jgi:hypothetical protein
MDGDRALLLLQNGVVAALKPFQLWRGTKDFLMATFLFTRETDMWVVFESGTFHMCGLGIAIGHRVVQLCVPGILNIIGSHPNELE